MDELLINPSLKEWIVYGKACYWGLSCRNDSDDLTRTAISSAGCVSSSDRFRRMRILCVPAPSYFYKPHSLSRPIVTELLQPRVFSLGLLKNRDIWVRVFPDTEELPVVFLSFLGIAKLLVDSGQFIMGQDPLLY